VAISAQIRVPVRGWVLYDGECGFCTRWVGFWARTLRGHGFEPAALQEEWVSEKLAMPMDALLADIRLLTPTSELISGAGVYLYVTRRIWWAFPFSAIFSLPGFNWIIRTGYRWFARNRYCVSGACRLKPH
jgi:predicted DCC family thiol-disulfide oxidoreductase YuxK